MANVPKQWIRKGDRNDFVTDYAMTSPEEDFAETYACYTLNTLKLWKVAIAQNSPALLEKARIRSAKQKFGRPFGMLVRTR